MADNRPKFKVSFYPVFDALKSYTKPIQIIVSAYSEMHARKVTNSIIVGPIDIIKVELP